MKILLDTNRLSDVLAGVEDAQSVVGTASEVHVPTIVLGEIRCGFLRGGRPERNEENLRWFLSQDTVDVAGIGHETSHRYARVCAELRARGRPIPTNDLWIAAIALDRDLVLFTRDEHFRQVPGLALA